MKVVRDKDGNVVQTIETRNGCSGCLAAFLGWVLIMAIIGSLISLFHH